MTVMIFIIQYVLFVIHLYLLENKISIKKVSGIFGHIWLSQIC